MIVERIQRLSEERKEVLSLPPEKAVDRILDAREPVALVHSFPEEDFHYLIHDIGPEDSLPLLSLASDKQLEYLLDVETWEKDRVDFTAVTRWINLFHQANPERFLKWFLHEKKAFIEFYLFKNLEVVVRETDQDPSDFGDAFFTLDDTFYIRIVEDPPLEAPGKIIDSARKETIKKFQTLIGDKIKCGDDDMDRIMKHHFDYIPELTFLDF